MKFSKDYLTLDINGKINFKKNIYSLDNPFNESKSFKVLDRLSTTMLKSKIYCNLDSSKSYNLSLIRNILKIN